MTMAQGASCTEPSIENDEGAWEGGQSELVLSDGTRQQSLATLKQEVLDVVFNDWLLKKFRTNLHRMSQENTIDTIVHDLEDLAAGTPPPRHLRHTPAASVP